MKANARGRQSGLLPGVLLLLGLLVRLPFLPRDSGISADVAIYQDWARFIGERGLVGSYHDSGINYPPVLVYLFGAAGALARSLPLTATTAESVLTALIKLPAAISDVLTAGLIAWAFRPQGARVMASACALYLFNPAVWYVSAYWGQTDSVYTFFLVAAVIALDYRAIMAGWSLVALALATKVQSLALAPLIVVVSLVRYGLRRTLIGVGAAVLTGAVVAAPWLLAGRVDEVIRAALTAANTVPRVVVSGYNFWYLLLRGNVHLVSADRRPAGLPFSIEQVALALFGVLALAVSLLVWRRRGHGVALAAAALSLGFYLFMPNVHERYLFPAIAFLLLSGRRYWWLMIIVSATYLFNLVTIAPFTTLLPANLVAQQPPYSTTTAVLKALSLLVAAINLVALGVLMLELVRRPRILAQPRSNRQPTDQGAGDGGRQPG